LTHMGASLYSSPKNTVPKGFGRHFYFKYQSLKWRFENDNKQCD
jgi:hypothetical protein